MKKLLGWAAFGVGIAVNIFKQISIGGHLTKMTNWMEAIEQTRQTMPIGAGGGIDSLPPSMQARAIRELSAGKVALAKRPRHVVTAELLKNREVALQFGRHGRASAITKLLEHLIDREIALGLEDFLKSYA
jgi:hypothetical protein